MDDLGAIRQDRDLAGGAAPPAVASWGRAATAGRAAGGGASLSGCVLVAQLDRIEAAALCLGVGGNVLVMNAAARRLVAARDGLGLSRDRLEGLTEADTLRLHRAIERTIRLGGAGRSSSSLVTLTGAAGDRVLPVEILPVPSCDRIGGRWVAAVLFVAGAAAGAVPAGCRLTAAETRLAAALAAGRSLKDHALASGISVETARWTLKQVFAKTGARRQADLVRLLLSGDPPTRSPAAALGRPAWGGTA